MALILRNNIPRPLTHDELDSNFIYLNIITWEKKNYIRGQYVVHTVSGATSLYRCDNGHTDYVYTQNSDNFTETYLNGLTTVRIWTKIGNEQGLSLVSGSYDGTNLVLVQSDETEIIIPITLTGGTGNVTIDDNVGLVFNGDDLSTQYNTLIADGITVPSTVGGITAGTTALSLKSKNIVQVIDDLLFPTVLPTYQIPTNTISSLTGTSALEIGSIYSATITQIADSNDAGAFTQLRIYRGASLLDTDSSPTLSAGIYTNTHIESYTIPAPASNNLPSILSYTGQGDYLAGTAKNDNKGVVDTRTPLVRSTSAPQAASTGFVSDAKTANAYYPWFFGTSATHISDPADVVTEIEAGNGTKRVATSSGTLSLNIGTSQQFFWFAIPNTYTLKNAWYETALNNGAIGSPGDPFIGSGSLFVAFNNSGSGYSIDSYDSYWTTNYIIYLQKPSSSGTTFTTGTFTIS
jgi:hypothetical protein